MRTVELPVQAVGSVEKITGWISGETTCTLNYWIAEYKEGIINLHLPAGKTYQFGDKGLEASWIVKSEAAIKRIARDWEYYLGETYVNGEWDVADCDLRDLLRVLRCNFTKISRTGWLSSVARNLQQWNRITRSYRNVAHHYDLADYREYKCRYDRLVSVGMFEHVVRPYYSLYFERIREMLQADGVALIHSIGRSGPPDTTNPWIRKYIFPGGNIPALSEMSRAAEESELMITDVEMLRLHYMHTQHCWYDRFQQNRSEIKARMGERFCRMWEFYLSICEVAFQYSDLVVFQMQLAQQHNVVPITRDYLYSDS